jgi:hypothetical protein
MTVTHSSGRQRIGAGLYVEVVLLLLVFASLAYTAIFTETHGYLPQPYYYGGQSLFTDWTVSAYFADNAGGTYTAFASVYPPLSFIFLKIFSVHSCYNHDDILSARDCDWMVPITLCAFFLVNVAIAYRAYAIRDNRTALIRTAAICLGLPSVYALERGNLIIPCFTVFMLGNSRVLRSARLKWICGALAINFKPYLILGLAGPLVRRRWRWVEGAGLAGLLVYLVTFAIYGDGNPFQVVGNIMAFATTDAHGLFERAIYASSYNPIVDLIHSNFPLMRFLGSRPVELLEWLLPLITNIGKLGTLTAFLIALMRPGVVPVHRLTALAIGWVLMSQDPGGYAELFYFFLVFMEPWRGPFLIIGLVTTYVLSLSSDVILIKVAHEFITSYLTNQRTGYDLGVTLGELIRPALVILVQYSLVGASLADAIRDRRKAQNVVLDPRPSHLSIAGA